MVPLNTNDSKSSNRLSSKTKTNKKLTMISETKMTFGIKTF